MASESLDGDGDPDHDPARSGDRMRRLIATTLSPVSPVTKSDQLCISGLLRSNILTVDRLGQRCSRPRASAWLQPTEILFLGRPSTTAPNFGTHEPSRRSPCAATTWTSPLCSMAGAACPEKRTGSCRAGPFERPKSQAPRPTTAPCARVAFSSGWAELSRPRRLTKPRPTSCPMSRSFAHRSKR
jgi:hypothetical protein